MKRRSLFKSILSVAGFNLLARNFSVTEPIDINAPDACFQLNDLFKDAKIRIDFILHDSLVRQSNGYWSRVR